MDIQKIKEVLQFSSNFIAMEGVSSESIETQNDLINYEKLHQITKIRK